MKMASNCYSGSADFTDLIPCQNFLTCLDIDLRKMSVQCEQFVVMLNDHQVAIIISPRTIDRFIIWTREDDLPIRRGVDRRARWSHLNLIDQRDDGSCGPQTQCACLQTIDKSYNQTFDL